MRTLPIHAVLALTLVAPTALAQDFEQEENPWYLQLGVGGVIVPDVDVTDGPEVSFDPGLAFSLLLGRDIAELGPLDVAAEFEAYYTFFNLKENDLNQFPGVDEKGARAYALMGNLAFSFGVGPNTDLYFGGGVGFAPRVKYDTFDTGNLRQDETDSVAAQAKVGVMWHMGGSYDVQMGYRFFRTETLDVFNSGTGRTSGAEFQQHALEFNFRWGI